MDYSSQGPLSMGFSRQEYWSGFPCPPPGDLPNPGIKCKCLNLLLWQMGSLPLVPPEKPILDLVAGIYPKLSDLKEKKKAFKSCGFRGQVSRNSRAGWFRFGVSKKIAAKLSAGSVVVQRLHWGSL